MKKEYKSPKIVVEDFSLIENIAMNTCSQTANHTKDDCSYDMTDEFDTVNIFYSREVCELIAGQDIVIDCLNGFMNVFSS